MCIKNMNEKMPGSQRSFPGINICIYLTKNLVPQLYPRTDEKPVFSKELVQEDLKDEFKAGSNSEWAADSQDELEDWIEEQGIQLRY